MNDGHYTDVKTDERGGFANKSMKRRIYNIILRTPIGARYGSINLVLAGKGLSGTLDLLERSNPFCGRVDGCGNCTISGQLVTLMRTIKYTAVGKITDESIELSLQGDQSNLKITGNIIGESEVTEQ